MLLVLRLSNIHRNFLIRLGSHEWNVKYIRSSLLVYADWFRTGTFTKSRAEYTNTCATSFFSFPASPSREFYCNCVKWQLQRGSLARPYSIH